MKFLKFLAMPIGMCLMANHLAALEQKRCIDIVLSNDGISFEAVK